MKTAQQPRLLICWYSATGHNGSMAQAVWRGALTETDCQTSKCFAEKVELTTLREADAYIFIGPENFAHLASGLRGMLERCFYPLETALAGRPYAAVIACGNDGRGAAHDLERICTGWRLKAVAETLIVRGEPSDAKLREAEDLGAALAAGLASGVF